MKLTTEELEAIARLRKIINSLTRDELKVFEYIWDNISVGEIVFIRDLEGLYSVRRPHLVARKLREKGLIERGEGCYNLPHWLRMLRKKVTSFTDLVKILERTV